MNNPADCPSSTPITGRQAKVLIIDDDPALLTGFADMLRLRLGDIEVETCCDPSRAVSEANDADYGVILCDLWMPNINGLQLLPRLRRAAPHAAIVIMSALCDYSVQHTASVLGAHAFLAKPFEREEACSVVKTLLFSPVLGKPAVVQQAAELPHTRPYTRRQPRRVCS